MQDKEGNWRQVDRIRDGVAVDRDGVQIAKLQERPVLQISDPVTITTASGKSFSGRISGFEGMKIIVTTKA